MMTIVICVTVCLFLWTRDFSEFGNQTQQNNVIFFVHFVVCEFLGTLVGRIPLVLQGHVINDSYRYVRHGSSWTQFIEPLLPNENLDIVVLTRVNKILFEEKGGRQGGRNSIEVIGVEAENLGTLAKINFLARKEIIISGGAY